jgi:hypothetical protein
MEEEKAAKDAAKKNEEKRRFAKEERKQKLISKYGEAASIKILNGRVWIGMTKEMAVESWGRPDDINRTVSASNIHEQWVYGRQYLYFENGILTTFQD